ncbi:hypothetical protein Tco_1370155, partial [Tanacetum coccineum]
MGKNTGPKEIRPVWNNTQRINHQNKFVPTAVLTRSGRIPVSTAKQYVNTATPKNRVNVSKSTKNTFLKSHSPIRRPFYKSTVLNTRVSKEKVNTVRVNGVNTVGQIVVSTVKGNGVTVVIASAGYVWRPKMTDLNNGSKYNSGSWISKRGSPQQALKYKGMFDNGSSRHMTGNKALLTKFSHVYLAKRGRDTKIPQSGGPPIKVGDEAVHKELGDRMERAATTTSSLEAEQDNDTQTRFEAASKSPMTHLSQELTHLEVGRIQTATLSTTEDGVHAITATIDGRDMIITEASIIRHLKLQDSEGLSSLTNAKKFTQLARMWRASKGYSGVVTPLFDTMLVQPQGEAPSTSPSRITSSPSFSSHHTTSNTLTTPPSIQITHEAEETATMPHDSPLPRGHTSRSDEVKKLEKQVRSGKQRRRARIVLSKDEDAADDPSKTGRKIAQIDTDPTISLVQDEGTSWFQEDVETQEKNSADTEIILEEETPTELIEDLGNGENGENKISTAGSEISTASHDVSTATATLVEDISRDFKGMSYQDIRTIFEKVWDQNQVFVPIGSEIEKEHSKPVEEETVHQEEVKTVQVVKESSRKTRGRRKKSLARKRVRETQSEESSKKQKLEDDAEKEELRLGLKIVSDEDKDINYEVLDMKYPIVDWESQSLEILKKEKCMCIRLQEHMENQ